MDQALVGAARRQVFRAHHVAAANALGIGLAERDVAGGVLVEQRVVEQQPAGRDRRGIRHQRHLAETARALVRVQHLRQHVAAFAGGRVDDTALLETHRNVLDQRALVGERLGAGDMAGDAVLVRRGEHLFRRDVRIADDAVLGRRGAAFPLMVVGEADGQVGAGTDEAQRRIALVVQELGAGMQRLVVLAPGGDRIDEVDARGGEDRIPEFRHRDFFGLVREDGACPCRRREGGNRPVDVEAGDQFQRRHVGLGAGAVGARHFVGILTGEQRRVFAGDGEPRRAVAEGGRHAVEEPARGDVETAVRRVAIAHQRRLLVREQRRHQRGAGLVGVLGDPPHQRQGVERRGHHQFLARLQAEANANGHFAQPVELLLVGERRVLVQLGHGRNSALRFRSNGPPRRTEREVDGSGGRAQARARARCLLTGAPASCGSARLS